MKLRMTSNLLKFIATTWILAILFGIGLSTSITAGSNFAVITCAILYGSLMLINGGHFGRKEYFEDLPLSDVGFRFHFFTFLSHNIVSVLWFAGSLNSSYESFSNILLTVLIWSFFLIGHGIYYISTRKSTIKGIDRHDLFD